MIINAFNYLIERNDFELYKLDLKFLMPVLLNSYERTYYLSRDNRYRVTIDKNIKFYSINPIKDYFKTFSDDEKTVVELKYDQQHFDGAKIITSHFPFRVTKNSKYVNATDKPCVDARPTKTPPQAKLVLCIIGNQAPSGPIPSVCKSVATPANSIAIWIRYTISAPPKAKLAAPATITEGFIFDANIARTFCKPNAVPSPKGGVLSGSE